MKRAAEASIEMPFLLLLLLLLRLGDAMASDSCNNLSSKWVHSRSYAYASNACEQQIKLQEHEEVIPNT